MTAKHNKIGELRRWCLNLCVEAYAKSLLHVLIQYVNEGGESYPSIERISREGGMSERKARNVIKSLERAGHVHVARSNGRKSNLYTLITNPAQRAALQTSNPAHKVGLNLVQDAASKSPNPAPQVSQPGTACRLLDKNGIESAGQGGTLSGDGADLMREVVS